MTKNNRKLFGTDGIRGEANVYPMTTDVAMQVGRATAHIVKTEGTHRYHRVVIGKDTRASGDMLENALSAGICSMGVDVLSAGVLPTPGIAFITSSMRADAGIVISASHNAYQDNGIKIFAGDGFKLPDEVESEIECLVMSDSLNAALTVGAEVGRCVAIEEVTGRYIVFLKNTFPKKLSLDGLRIVVDCANGAAYRCAPSVFEELGAKVDLIGVTPDGENINASCGSLSPEVAADMVVRTGADLGLTLDGDADRAIFIDHQGRIIDGDHIMAICAIDLHARGKLAHETVVATVMSNMGLEAALKSKGLQMIRTAVGDRYVVEAMRSGGYNFGGEQSGHTVFLDHNTTGDGILTALQVLAVMQRKERSLSELAGVMDTYPQVLLNVEVARRVDLKTVDEVEKQCRLVRGKLNEQGRLLVRYSGTEPLVRVMIEGEDNDLIQLLALETAACIRKALN